MNFAQCSFMYLLIDLKLVSNIDNLRIFFSLSPGRYWWSNIGGWILMTFAQCSFIYLLIDLKLVSNINNLRIFFSLSPGRYWWSNPDPNQDSHANAHDQPITNDVTTRNSQPITWRLTYKYKPLAALDTNWIWNFGQCEPIAIVDTKCCSGCYGFACIGGRHCSADDYNGPGNWNKIVHTKIYFKVIQNND